MAVIPSTNVNLATNIRDVLNAAGGSVSNDTLSFFATSAKINKWAFYKPESFKKDFNLTETDRYNNNHGFDATTISNISVEALFTNAKSGNIWNYILPKGGSDSPYRLGDFRLYNTEAQPPFDYRYLNKEGSSISDTYTTSWRVVGNPNAEIKMSDLYVANSTGATHYFFIARKSGTYIKSSLVSKSGDPDDIVCDITFPSTGTWEWIFCVGQNSSETTSTRLDVVVMPNGYGTFEFKKVTVYINITYTGKEVTRIDYDKSQYLLTIGDVSPSYSMVASNTTTPITDTVLEFGYVVHLLDSSKNEIAKNGIYSTSSSDRYTFNSVNGTQTKALMDFPGQLDLKEYFAESDLYNAAYARFYPAANRVTGAGVPMNPNTYYDVYIGE